MLPPSGCIVLDSEDEASGGVSASDMPSNDGFVPDSMGMANGGDVHNLEQQPDKGLSAILEDQHKDGIEQLVSGEELAGLQDDADAAAGDEGVDEFAETCKGMLWLLVPLYFTLPH